GAFVFLVLLIVERSGRWRKVEAQHVLVYLDMQHPETQSSPFAPARTEWYRESKSLVSSIKREQHRHIFNTLLSAIVLTLLCTGLALYAKPDVTQILTDVQYA